MEDARDERPEEDLGEEDVEEDAHPGGAPHLHEHVLPHPVNLQQVTSHPKHKQRNRPVGSPPLFINSPVRLSYEPYYFNERTFIFLSQRIIEQP